MRPYRTCGHRPEPLISGLPPLCLIFDPKPIVPLRTSLKKSKKTSSENITFKNSMRPYRTYGYGGSCGIIFKLFSARCFLQKYGRSDPLAQNGLKSLYCRSKSMKIDKKRCTVVFFPQKSMKIVVLSFKIDGIRYIFYQKQPFRCGRPEKNQKNVKRKHNFFKFGAPLSHLRPLCRIF